MFCVVLAGSSWEAFYNQIELCKDYTNLFELRLDYLEKIEERDLKDFLAQPYRFICTFRAKEEGGCREIPLEERWHFLRLAGEAGAFLVDIEWRHLFIGKFKKLIKNSPLFPERLLFSYHHFEGTPPLKFLKTLLRRASSQGIKWFKIATMVNSLFSSFELLGLISYGEGLGLKVIAFGMGEKGRLSRILSLLVGSPFTYVFPPQEKPIAPGQMDLISAKRLFEVLKDV